MRSPAILVFTLALEALSFFGAENAPMITKATVTIVPNIGDLNKICNTNVYIDGCTAFREVFSCSCKQMLQRWQLDVSVRVTPSIYVWKLKSVGHENDHIGDIREALLRYVNDLEARGYPSSNECRDVAQHETDGFHHLMDTFKEDSNAKRHPFYRRRLPLRPEGSH